LGSKKMTVSGSRIALMRSARADRGLEGITIFSPGVCA
jgi:hypothetical protein